MRNIMDGFMKRHLRVETWRDGRKIDSLPIDDPFVNTTVSAELKLSWLAWIRHLFGTPIVTRVRVHVSADTVAAKRWFAGQDGCDRCGRTIGFPHDGSSAADPGYHHGPERLCESCYYGTEAPKPTAQCCDQQSA